ncbi:hypothetical protein CsSME_00003189 [Camellia sinensis var. sinensis]
MVQPTSPPTTVTPISPPTTDNSSYFDLCLLQRTPGLELLFYLFLARATFFLAIPRLQQPLEHTLASLW